MINVRRTITGVSLSLSGIIRIRRNDYTVYGTQYSRLGVGHGQTKKSVQYACMELGGLGTACRPCLARRGPRATELRAQRA